MSFLDFLHNADTLKSALKNNPNLILKQDDDGMTILHHAGTLGRLLGTNSIAQILAILFEVPNLDFSVRDHHQNTPLHIVAMCCHERTTCNYVFPAFIAEADRRGFDFTVLGSEIVDRALRTAYYGKEITINKFLREITNKYIVEHLKTVKTKLEVNKKLDDIELRLDNLENILN